MESVDMGDRNWFVLYVLVCLEVGIFLTFVPWSAIWERNYFLDAYPALRPFLLDPSFRGAVTGLGIANLYVVLHEVLGRRRESAVSSTQLFPGGFRVPGAGGRRERAAGASSGGGAAEPRAMGTQEKRS